MRICEDHSDCVVVYTSTVCPVCAEIHDNEDEIKDKSDALRRMESELDELTTMLDDTKALLNRMEELAPECSSVARLQE